MSASEVQEDPMTGADVGEVRTITHETELHGVDMEPRVFWGSDRDGNADIADVEVVHHDDRADDIRITWEGDIMKTLPRNWDYSREPLTESQGKQQKRRTWLRRMGQVAVPLAVIGLTTFIATYIMDSVAGSMTINGQPVAMTSVEPIWGTVLVLSLCFILVQHGLKGGLPGRAGGGR